MSRKVSKAQRKYGPLPGELNGRTKVGCYPVVYDEDTTITLVQETYRSLARFGDGEFSICTGGTCISQRDVPDSMRVEMRQVLAEPGECLVGIPNIYSATPKRPNWLRYGSTRICDLLPHKAYGSSFITRPDSAPWIDNEKFWNKVRALWVNQHVTLVYGGENSKSLKPDWLLRHGALSVRAIEGPRSNAYHQIDKLEAEVGQTQQPVIICLGPTATILAWRLDKRKVWAIDLGHVGMFIPS